MLGDIAAKETLHLPFGGDPTGHVRDLIFLKCDLVIGAHDARPERLFMVLRRPGCVHDKVQKAHLRKPCGEQTMSLFDAVTVGVFVPARVFQRQSFHFDRSCFAEVKLPATIWNYEQIDIAGLAQTWHSNACRGMLPKKRYSQPSSLRSP